MFALTTASQSVRHFRQIYGTLIRDKVLQVSPSNEGVSAATRALNTRHGNDNVTPSPSVYIVVRSLEIIPDIMLVLW